MKKIILIFIISRIILFLISILAPQFIPLRAGYLGKIGWDNMDGVHYTSIAQNGYFQYEQAFFPGYPLLIKLLNRGIGIDASWAGYIISNIFILVSAFVLYKLIKEKFSSQLANWSVIFLFAFPTSFFFSAVYTESFFLFLVLASFYFSHKQKWLLAGIFGALASATRLAGIFILPALLIEWFIINSQLATRNPTAYKLKIKQLLSICLIPLGLLVYMYYLYISVGDHLFFFHSQPAFGAGRSGDRLILLPQVIYRYFNIFTTASLNYDYLIAVLEILSFILVVILLLKNLKKIPPSWQIFSWLSLLVPTLTGSLSSLPRYLLTVFPLYYLLSLEPKIIRYLLLIIFIILQFFLTGFYLRGYFVA